jgi:4-azaleucine resistance transporter AzlC
MDAQTFSRRSEFLGGARATIPLIVGALPFGIIFGALAVSSGISVLGAAAMSLFVFAGSAQFIAVGLAASFTPIPVIILTTFVVNLRHALYSATLAPYVKHLPQRWIAPLGFWLTDETFLVAVQRYHQPDALTYKHWYYLGSALSMYMTWQLWTWLGIAAASAIDQAQLASLGLDFALIVTFIGMLVPMMKGRPTFAAVIAAGATAVIATPLPHQLGLIVAALVGVVTGMAAETWGGKPLAAGDWRRARDTLLHYGGKRTFDE